MLVARALVPAVSTLMSRPSHLSAALQSNNRRGLLQENILVMHPAPWIRQPDHRAAPTHGGNRAQHIALYRSNHSGDARWPKLFDCLRQRLFSSPAFGTPRFRIQPVHRLRAQVNQIMTRRLERPQEGCIGDGRVHRLKCLPQRAIEPGIAAIEEPPRSRRRFTDEQQTHPLGAIALSQPLALA